MTHEELPRLKINCCLPPCISLNGMEEIPGGNNDRKSTYRKQVRLTRRRHKRRQKAHSSVNPVIRLITPALLISPITLSSPFNPNLLFKSSNFSMIPTNSDI